MIKEYRISLIIGIFTFSIFCLLIGSLFIEGTRGIGYGHIKRNGEAARNTTDKLEKVMGFLLETGGFATHHFIDNFLFVSFFSSSVVYLPSYFGIIVVKLTIKIYLYFIVILKQLSFAAIYEFLERFIIYCFEFLLFFFSFFRTD
jgi:hypothetical protein